MRLPLKREPHSYYHPFPALLLYLTPNVTANRFSEPIPELLVAIAHVLPRQWTDEYASLTRQYHFVNGYRINASVPQARLGGVFAKTSAGVLVRVHSLVCYAHSRAHSRAHFYP